MNEPTPSYFRALERTQSYHAAHKTYSGRFFFRYAPDVAEIIEEFGCKTLLDYGCGKGIQWEPREDGTLLADELGVEVTKYDPGVPEFSKDPVGQFDIVVCTQVLGAIPVDSLPWVVNRLYGYARMAVYVGEKLTDHVRKRLHDDMKDEMPHGWSHEQWAEVLRRDSGVPLFLRTRDKRPGGSHRLERF